MPEKKKVVIKTNKGSANKPNTLFSLLEPHKNPNKNIKKEGEKK